MRKNGKPLICGCQFNLSFSHSINCIIHYGKVKIGSVYINLFILGISSISGWSFVSFIIIWNINVIACERWTSLITLSIYIVFFKSRMTTNRLEFITKMAEEVIRFIYRKYNFTEIGILKYMARGYSSTLVFLVFPWVEFVPIFVKYTNCRNVNLSKDGNNGDRNYDHGSNYPRQPNLASNLQSSCTH